MAVDYLQEKIRKCKNPSMLNLVLGAADLPPHLVEAAKTPAEAYGQFCGELLRELKDIIPAIRLSFSAFTLLGDDGLSALSSTMKLASNLGCYVLLEAPGIYNVTEAQQIADLVWGEGKRFACDALLVPGYGGSDILKPFLPFCGEKKKDLFVVARTANKSASELQDLLSGTRLVHMVAADLVNRYGAGTVGKSGYARVGVLAAASAPESLRMLRTKYPQLFMIMDGMDYPNSNAKNCSFGFDRFGHGAIACAGTSITCAWKQQDSDGRDYLTHAVAAAERMKKKLTRYAAVL